MADTRDDPGNVLAARDREAGIVTYLGLPVKIRDSVVGVLAFHTTAPRRYADADLAYLGSFADHAAVALDNGRLYDEAQRALGDLRAMQQRLVQGETLRALGELAGGAAHHLNNLLTIGQQYKYRFETGEIKKPIQEAVTACGWIYKGVVFGKL